MSAIVLICETGDLSVASGYHRMLDRGNWVATLYISEPAAPAAGTPATLRFIRQDESVDDFVGTVRRSGIVPGSDDLFVTVVGGNGALIDPPLPARHHTAGSSTVPAGLIAEGIAQAAGETLAAGVESALDAYPLQRYTRLAGEAGEALEVLTNALAELSGNPDFAWRMLADGTLWIGIETWPVVEGYDPGESPAFAGGTARDGMILYSTDGAPLRPGQTIGGHRAVEVDYKFTAGSLLAEVRHAMPGDGRREMPIAPYRASYVGTVVARHDDLTLDIKANDDRLGDDLRDIPFKLSIPGTKVTVPEGSIVRVRFQDASPTGAYACDIDMDAAASKAIALVDDATGNGTLAIAMVGPVPTFTYTPPGGAPQVGTSVNLSGKITGPGHAYAKGVQGS